MLYFTTPFARVIALDAETGKELWTFDPKLNRELRYNLFINRGVSYWRSGEDKRIFLGTDDGRLFALNARTGKPVPSFGNDGWIDLRTGVAEEFPKAGYGLTSPVAIYRDLVITGSLVPNGEPQGPSGGMRAFDARTGKLVWRFHTVPRPGEFGNDTWEGDSWKNRGGVNAWSMMSVDHERGIVFAPLAQPATGYYGGDRKGQNLFGEFPGGAGRRHRQTDLALPDNPSRHLGLGCARPAESCDDQQGRQGHSRGGADHEDRLSSSCSTGSRESRCFRWKSGRFPRA